MRCGAVCHRAAGRAGQIKSPASAPLLLLSCFYSSTRNEQHQILSDTYFHALYSTFTTVQSGHIQKERENARLRKLEL